MILPKWIDEVIKNHYNVTIRVVNGHSLYILVPKKKNIVGRKGAKP